MMTCHYFRTNLQPGKAAPATECCRAEILHGDVGQDRYVLDSDLADHLANGLPQPFGRLRGCVGQGPGTVTHQVTLPGA